MPIFPLGIHIIPCHVWLYLYNCYQIQTQKHFLHPKNVSSPFSHSSMPQSHQQLSLYYHSLFQSVALIATVAQDILLKSTYTLRCIVNFSLLSYIQLKKKKIHQNSVVWLVNSGLAACLRAMGNSHHSYTQHVLSRQAQGI